MAKRLSARRKVEDYEIEMPDGQVRKFLLMELMGDAREEFIAFNAGKMKFDKKGRPTGVGDMKGVACKLLSLGLHCEQKKALLTEAEIAALGLPGRVLGELSQALSVMSGLTEDTEDDAKNS